MPGIGASGPAPGAGGSSVGAGVHATGGRGCHSGALARVGVTTASPRCETLVRMDAEHQDALRRIYQADRQLHDEGRDAEDFHLIYTGGMQRGINHPAWNSSWASPTKNVIDDLEELGLLRVEPHNGNGRTFALSMQGRDQGKALHEAVTFPAAVGGRAPALEVVLPWLVRTAEDAPETLERPTRLIERAINDGLVEPSGREAFAKRVLALINEGYATGQVPVVDQISAEQTLQYTEGLAVTMKAHDAIRADVGAGATVNVYGPVVNSQVAGGDITNTTTFVNILERADRAIDALDGVDDETKAQAKGVISALLGRGAAGIVSEAAGSLVAAVLSKLLGLSTG
jgi:hypothetical protein